MAVLARARVRLDAATQTEGPSCCSVLLAQLRTAQSELARARRRLQAALHPRQLVDQAMQTEAPRRPLAASSAEGAAVPTPVAPPRPLAAGRQSRCPLELIPVSQCKPEVFDLETDSSDDANSDPEHASGLSVHLAQFTATAEEQELPMDFISGSPKVKIEGAIINKRDQETASSRLNRACTDQESDQKPDAYQTAKAAASAAQPSWSSPATQIAAAAGGRQARAGEGRGLPATLSPRCQFPGHPAGAHPLPVKEEFVDINDFQMPGGDCRENGPSAGGQVSQKGMEGAVSAPSNPVVPLLDLTALCHTVSSLSDPRGSASSAATQEGLARPSSLDVRSHLGAGPALAPGIALSETNAVDGGLVDAALQVGFPPTYRRRRRLLLSASGPGPALPQPGRPHCCALCGRAFASLWHLQRHRLSHTGERPHRCRTCGRAFARPEHLRRHARRHTGERPFACEVCGRAFAQRETLTLHMRTHAQAGPRHYACSACGLVFQQHAEYAEHRRLHPGERPLQCELCGRAFSQHAALVEHRRIHTGERPLTCGYCGRAFRQNSALKRHERLHVAQRTDGPWAGVAPAPDSDPAPAPTLAPAAVQLCPAVASSISLYKQ